MKTLFIVIVGSAFLLNSCSRTSACGGGGGGGGDGGGSSGGDSGRRSNNRRTTVSKSPRGLKYTQPDGKTTFVGKLGIRDRDETGHRTGLGTLGKSLIENPKETVKAVEAFVDSYQDMRKANVIGGNIDAHEKANKEATEVANSKVAAAISAAREQYKSVRAKENPDGTVHIGDTRTDEEIKDTMDANKRGREKAEEEKNEKNDR